MRETVGSFDLASHINEWEPAVYYELHESNEAMQPFTFKLHGSKLPVVPLIEFIRSKFSFVVVHVNGTAALILHKPGEFSHPYDVRDHGPEMVGVANRPPSVLRLLPLPFLEILPTSHFGRHFA